MEVVKIGFYFILYFLEFFLAFITLSFLVAVIVLYLPINPNYQQKGDLKEVYVKSNGVHVDIVIPIDHKFDWGDWIGMENFNSKHAKYLSVGWGDKGFYVDTPEWSDLKFSTAFRALFLNTQTLMHVTVMDKPELNSKCKSLKIDSEQYRLMIDAIKERFVKDENGKPVIIPGVGYTPDDNFYEAHGSYSMFVTCNVWTNNVLKRMKVKTVLWAPLEQWVMKYL
jgi:uncharacterized protein (TIGR02117 family)